MKEDTKELVKAESSKDLIMAMAQVAVEKADVGTLERLAELRRQMKEEMAKEEFYKAFSAFQSELKPIKKSNIVRNKDGTVRYSYASYDDIIAAIQPLFEKYKLSYRFETEFEEKSVKVKCIITHCLGHQETSSFKTVVEYSGRMLPIQEWGAALTYSKRYSLSLACGLATEEDTDAIVDSPDVSAIEKLRFSVHNALETQKGEEDARNYDPDKKSFPAGVKREIRGASASITDAQERYIYGFINRSGQDKAIVMKEISDIVGREIVKMGELTKDEASKVITILKDKES